MTASLAQFLLLTPIAHLDQPAIDAWLMDKRIRLYSNLHWERVLVHPQAMELVRHLVVGDMVRLGDTTQELTEVRIQERL